MKAGMGNMVRACNLEKGDRFIVHSRKFEVLKIADGFIQYTIPGERRRVSRHSFGEKSKQWVELIIPQYADTKDDKSNQPESSDC